MIKPCFTKDDYHSLNCLQNYMRDIIRYTQFTNKRTEAQYHLDRINVLLHNMRVAEAKLAQMQFGSDPYPPFE